jgi:hypothetical protein
VNNDGVYSLFPLIKGKTPSIIFLASSLNSSSSSIARTIAGLISFEFTRVLSAKGLFYLYSSKAPLRTAFADVLKYIPYDYSADLTIRLIKEEQDVSVKTFLACALCDIFSLKGAGIIKDMIATRRYQPKGLLIITLLRQKLL